MLLAKNVHIHYITTYCTDGSSENLQPNVLTYRDKKNREYKKNFAYLRKKKFFNNRYVTTAVHRQVQVHALNIFLSKKWFGWIIQTFSAFSTALVL